MDEIYVVKVTVADEDETIVRLLDNKFFTDREEAREAMMKDFNAEKSDADDGIDDVQTGVFSLDSLSFSVNSGEVDRSWDVVRLTKDGCSEG